MQCNICKSKNTKMIYNTDNGSLSSICEISQNNISVYKCNNCLHVFTDFEIDSKEYYDDQYNILTNSEEEDQLYEVTKSGEKIFRTQHQVNLLKKSFNLDKNTKILDFGCAKSSTMKLLSQEIGIKPYLFDVSDKYIAFWEKFTSSKYYATYETPKEWNNTFSLITSYFSLEHIEKPIEAVKKIYDLLEEDGIFYFIVPDPLVNIGDMIVNEHINHFTKNSIKYLLKTNDFSIQNIDFKSYYGAMVVTAKKEKEGFGKNYQHSIDTKIDDKIESIAQYWKSFDKRIKNIQSNLKGKKFAIYGSGFYGSLIYSKLSDKKNLQCFIDQNPYRQQEKNYGHDILAFENLPEDVSDVIVGLNPNKAKEIISELQPKRKINFIYV